MWSVFPVKSAAVQSVTRSPWIIHRAFSRFCQIVLGLTLNPSAQQVNQGSFFTHAGTQGQQKALNGQHFSGNKTVENSLEHQLNSKGCRIWYQTAFTTRTLYTSWLKCLSPWAIHLCEVSDICGWHPCISELITASHVHRSMDWGWRTDSLHAQSHCSTPGAERVVVPVSQHAQCNWNAVIFKVKACTCILYVEMSTRESCGLEPPANKIWLIAFAEVWTGFSLWRPHLAL